MGAQINPYLMSKDARGQAEFYIESLGGEIQFLATYGETPGTPEAMKDNVMHLALTVAGTNTLMMADSFEPVSYSRSISISLSYGEVVDKFGVTWMITKR